MITDLHNRKEIWPNVFSLAKCIIQNHSTIVWLYLLAQCMSIAIKENNFSLAYYSLYWSPFSCRHLDFSGIIKGFLKIITNDSVLSRCLSKSEQSDREPECANWSRYMESKDYSFYNLGYIFFFFFFFWDNFSSSSTIKNISLYQLNVYWLHVLLFKKNTEKHFLIRHLY